jgi:4-hydroxythreonine-4-phosphate dehydrogenase
MAEQPPLAVTIGEPAGIGPDLILLALSRRNQRRLPPMIVVSDPALLRLRADAIGLELPPTDGEFQIVWEGKPMRGLPGKPCPDDAPAVIGAIEAAVAMVQEGAASAIVTSPISKAALLNAGFGHPGHTEFLAELAARRWGGNPNAVMMLAGPRLRTVPITIHIPLREVAVSLTKEKIVGAGAIVATELKSKFGIERPRLAVAGLNPHAGEDGKIGTEDVAIIRPAVEALRADGIDVTGPFPADTLFHEQARVRYDAVLCMYHDQALIPAKMLDFDATVNVTLGLPFIRTSPDHGTAFDIAGSGNVRPDSFLAALDLAWDMAQRAMTTRT